MPIVYSLVNTHFACPPASVGDLALVCLYENGFYSQYGGGTNVGYRTFVPLLIGDDFTFIASAYSYPQNIQDLIIGGLFLRQPGRNSENGYGLGFYQNGKTSLRIARVSSGAVTALGTYDLQSGVTPWTGYMRGSCVGDSLKLKGWTSSEPEWQIQVTDSNFTSGYVGWAQRYQYTTAQRIVRLWNIELSIAKPSHSPVSGNVKRAGANQSGVTVFLVRRGADLTKPLMPGIDITKATTDANGNYSVDVDTDAEDWFVVPDYETGGNLYSAIARRVRWS